MGLLGPTLLVALMVAATESQIVFPSRMQTNSLNKVEHCTASNGQRGACYEFRSRAFQECSYFPSLDSRNPNVERHLKANVCKNTGKEIFFCCPSNTALPIRQPIAKVKCQAIKCPRNAICLEGIGNTSPSCKCQKGYKSTGSACRELKANNRLNIQRFGGSSALHNQRHSWNRNPARNRYQYHSG